MKRIHTQTNGSVPLLLEELRKGSEVVGVSPIRIISIHLRCVWSSTGHQRRTNEMTCDLLQMGRSHPGTRKVGSTHPTGMLSCW